MKIRIYPLLYLLLFGSFTPSLFAQADGDSSLNEVAAPIFMKPYQPPVRGVFNDENLEVEVPEVVMNSTETPIKFHYKGYSEYLANNTHTFTINGIEQEIEFEEGEGKGTYIFDGEKEIVVEAGTFSFKQETYPIPLWLSIIPPLLAILMALIFREVITALIIGIFFGGAIIHVYISGVTGVGSGLLAVLDTYVLEALNDSDHLSVILFSMLIGAIVALISRNGGMLGVVNRISKFAKDPKTGQLATWGLGVGIFFDDYANTLVVGNTMRPVTDRLRISREKLSYIVDSTAAPISAIAFITTWIGAELGYIRDGVAQINEAGGAIPGDPSPYGIFISSLEYSFYPLLTLAFMLIIILRNRDYGPMYKAEIRARTTGQVALPSTREGEEREHSQELDDLQPVRNAIPRAFNAVIPILVIIIGTVVGLVHTGLQGVDDAIADPVKYPGFEEMYNGSGIWGKISLIIGQSNSYVSLIWASMLSLISALILTLSQRIMPLEQCIEAVLSGFKTMMHAMIILIMAWALAKVTADLHTADFITQILGHGVSPYLIPAITFLLAAVVSFSTGSSWGTMAILYPLLIPASWVVATKAGLSPEEAMPILYNTVACVLAGSVLGDHCSPISDTTILSSLATSCNHIDHVRTQLPYAITVGLVAIFIGTVPAALGVPFWITLPAGIGALYGVVSILGKKVEVEDT